MKYKKEDTDKIIKCFEAISPENEIRDLINKDNELTLINASKNFK